MKHLPVKRIILSSTERQVPSSMKAVDICWRREVIVGVVREDS
ncbi:hypothetical protein FOXB_16156 [Fusarium oxysporum f. sp. conglutinans Fo5176]|uniref:Uncharacterized protein n=1 Tax=Fusarium oxysporum (strain Fo5176) TaxID=660025 RepID=F9GBX3_FUSOF|nr:hypothetical protein FOXB_16156 [Fusarium oxysporum f. sp. conglutinans Fo5176]